MPAVPSLEFQALCKTCNKCVTETNKQNPGSSLGQEGGEPNIRGAEPL